MIDFGKVIAHRGASAYEPENTLAAFKKAKELGAQWMECDVRLTRDGKVIVFHDNRLNRMTNSAGWIRWKKHSTLQKLKIGLNERIVHLEELLDFLEEIGLSVNIEIKKDFGRVRKTVKKVMEILHQKPRKNISLLISSFSERSLHEVRKRDKTIHLGLLMEKWNPRWQSLADQLNCVSIHCSKNILTTERILEIKKTGRQVLVFTINNHKEVQQHYHMGVDAVFSDYPDLLRIE